MKRIEFLNEKGNKKQIELTLKKLCQLGQVAETNAEKDILDAEIEIGDVVSSVSKGSLDEGTGLTKIIELMGKKEAIKRKVELTNKAIDLFREEVDENGDTIPMETVKAKKK